MRPAQGCRPSATTESVLFANHVHRFDTLNHPPGRVKRSEALHGSDPAFDRTVILLHHIIEIANRSTTAAPTEFLSPLQFIDGPRIGRIPVHVDHARPRMVG